METLQAKRESAVKSVRGREAKEREARKGKFNGGGSQWFGYTTVYANPEETNKNKRMVLRRETNPVEADLLRHAAERTLRGESVGSVIREWQGKKYPGQWSAVFDVDTHERLARLFADPARRAHVVGRKLHLLSGIAAAACCSRSASRGLFSTLRSRNGRAP